MRISHSPANLFTGIHNPLLDKRKFESSREDIKRICRFFSIGELRHYEKEKGPVLYHANFFVFVATTRGHYALKFYPPDTAQAIAVEYAINRILTNHHFPTPIMYAGQGGQPFFASNDRLAACYSYIDGLPAWQHINQRNTFPKINTAMLSLKNILSDAMRHVPSPKKENLSTTINALVQSSRLTAYYDQKETINASLLDACQTYKHHQRLFTRQWLHSDANLTNFLIYKKTVYTLDLSHIQEDYVLSDLTSLIPSCLLLNIPAKKIKTIVKDYFTRHKIKPEYFLVLNTLIKIKLIKDYLRNIRRKESIDLSTYPPDLMHTYIFHLSKHQESIAAVLKKMHDAPPNTFQLG
jgi:Ser/Thr protein kinase RdoA (MazF antagonist)